MVMTDLKRNVILLAVLPICGCLIGTASLKFALAGCALLLILFIKTSLAASNADISDMKTWRIIDYEDLERYEQLILQNEKNKKDLLYYLLYIPTSYVGFTIICILLLCLTSSYDVRFIYGLGIILVIDTYIKMTYGSFIDKHDAHRKTIRKFINLLKQKLQGNPAFKFRLMARMDETDFRDICVMLESNFDDRELRHAVIYGKTSSFNRSVILDHIYMTLIFKNEMNDADQCQRAMESMQKILMNAFEFSKNLSCNFVYKTHSQTGVMIIKMATPHMMSDFTSEKNLDCLTAVIERIFKTSANAVLF